MLVAITSMRANAMPVTSHAIEGQAAFLALKDWIAIAGAIGAVGAALIAGGFALRQRNLRRPQLARKLLKKSVGEIGF